MKFPVYLHRLFLRKSLRGKMNSEVELKFFSKRSVITNLFSTDRRIQIYNGNKFVNLTFSREMLNHKLGEFCFTKRIGIDIHKKDKKIIKKK